MGPPLRPLRMGLWTLPLPRTQRPPRRHPPQRSRRRPPPILPALHRPRISMGLSRGTSLRRTRALHQAQGPRRPSGLRPHPARRRTDHTRRPTSGLLLPPRRRPAAYGTGVSDGAAGAGGDRSRHPAPADPEAGARGAGRARSGDAPGERQGVPTGAGQLRLRDGSQDLHAGTGHVFRHLRPLGGGARKSTGSIHRAASSGTVPRATSRQRDHGQDKETEGTFRRCQRNQVL
mmetsp:Transcript_42745/g.100365  ORF Transcript_42745/g.100365 Transcript_42745/m.100365 type:complete len:232 (-) Transcript_42745:160-855(-)